MLLSMYAALQFLCYVQIWCYAAVFYGGLLRISSPTFLQLIIHLETARFELRTFWVPVYRATDWAVMTGLFWWNLQKTAWRMAPRTFLFHFSGPTSLHLLSKSWLMLTELPAIVRPIQLFSPSSPSPSSLPSCLAMPGTDSSFSRLESGCVWERGNWRRKRLILRSGKFSLPEDTW